MITMTMTMTMMLTLSVMMILLCRIHHQRQLAFHYHRCCRRCVVESGVVEAVVVESEYIFVNSVVVDSDSIRDESKSVCGVPAYFYISTFLVYALLCDSRTTSATNH